MPRCPSCSTQLTQVEEDEIQSAVCANCFGTWINSIALKRRVRLDAVDASGATTGGPEAASLTDLAAVVEESNTAAALRCPQCENLMAKDRVHPMIPVQIDRCSPCGYIWLDAGEMPLLRRLYKELMASNDPEIVRRREKVAAVTAAWEGRSTLSTDVGGDLNRAGMVVAEAFNLLTFLMGSV